MQDDYKVLGLTKNATEDEVEQSYRELKSKYSNDRFLPGKEGNEAAKNLTALESAYKNIKEDWNKQTINSSYNEEYRGYTSDYKETEATNEDFLNSKNRDIYTAVESEIKSGNINTAQAKLDECDERDAEWHYLQSIVFYKKNWSNESKKQLEIALSISPQNAKYKKSYAKLKEKLESDRAQYQKQQQQTGGYGNDNQQMGSDGCNDACNCCQLAMCMNCLCNCCH